MTVHTHHLPEPVRRCISEHFDLPPGALASMLRVEALVRLDAAVSFVAVDLDDEGSEMCQLASAYLEAASVYALLASGSAS